jgi:hypothetical protein
MIAQAKPAAFPSPVTETANGAAVLPLADFRELMNHVNRECRGIGCGYSRRRCRTDVVSTWLRTWAAGNRQRLSLLPKIRAELTDKLPEYFREHSEYDKAIEDEDAFRRVHAQIAAALA